MIFFLFAPTRRKNDGRSGVLEFGWRNLLQTMKRGGHSMMMRGGWVGKGGSSECEKLRQPAVLLGRSALVVGWWWELVNGLVQLILSCIFN